MFSSDVIYPMPIEDQALGIVAETLLPRPCLDQCPAYREVLIRQQLLLRAWLTINEKQKAVPRLQTD